MKNKILKKIYVALGLALCSMSLLGAPKTALNVQAAGDDVKIEEPSRSDYLVWIYKKEDGALWKRLWNASTEEWVGEWIFVRWL